MRVAPDGADEQGRRHDDRPGDDDRGGRDGEEHERGQDDEWGDASSGRGMTTAPLVRSVISQSISPVGLARLGAGDG